ncbi:MAG: DUF2066 domain-containing protein [Pseudomonadota bacterium]
MTQRLRSSQGWPPIAAPLAACLTGLLTWLVIALSFGAGSAAAALPDNFYRVNVPVASRSAEDRRTAAGQGLRVMLTRLTGLTDVADSPPVAKATANPEDYFSQYRYVRTQRFDDWGQPITELEVTFVPAALRRLQAAAALPLWPLNRPRVVLWLLEDDGGEQRLISDAQHPLADALLAHSRWRGLPMTLPGGDAVDVANITARAALRGDPEALARAGARYDAQISLLGRVESLGDDNWLVRWTAQQGERPQRLRLSGGLANVALAPVDMIADALVAQFTVAGGRGGQLALEIAGIASVAAYGGVLKYLGSLSYVSEVAVRELRGSSLLVDVTTGSDAAKFLQLLAVDARLVAIERSGDPLSTAVTAQPVPLGAEPVLSTPAGVLQVSWQD